MLWGLIRFQKTTKQTLFNLPARKVNQGDEFGRNVPCLVAVDSPHTSSGLIFHIEAGINRTNVIPDERIFCVDGRCTILFAC